MHETLYDELQVSLDEIGDFCRRWQVAELALFGSVLRDDFKPNSDIDVLVMFTPDAKWSLLDHVRMEQELTSVFGRKVDLVSKRAIQQSENWIRRREILTTAQPVYVSGYCNPSCLQNHSTTP
jgi:predicted nucleotidyltransferase